MLYQVGRPKMVLEHLAMGVAGSSLFRLDEIVRGLPVSSG